MIFRKLKLATSDGGYAVGTATLLGTNRVLAASEKDGPAFMFTPPDFSRTTLSDGPGGCMGFAPVSGRDDALLMITGFYPVFLAEKAGINLLRAGESPSDPWSSERVVELPFVHRITTMETADGPILVAATVCGGKDFRDDWTRPGAVYAIPIPKDPQGPWEPRVVADGIRQNHGMSAGTYGGGPCVYVSGTEGVFALRPPAGPGGSWESTMLLDTPVSELAVLDLDEDGEDEILVIEPFHGETFGVYKRSEGAYRKVYASELAFGHGLWAGSLGGRPVALVGNRAGTKDLVCYEMVRSEPFEMRMSVVDAGSGTANLTVIVVDGKETIVAANPEHAEYARYVVQSESLGGRHRYGRRTEKN